MSKKHKPEDNGEDVEEEEEELDDEHFDEEEEEDLVEADGDLGDEEEGGTCVLVIQADRFMYTPLLAYPTLLGSAILNLDIIVIIDVRSM